MNRTSHLVMAAANLLVGVGIGVALSRPAPSQANAVGSLVSAPLFQTVPLTATLTATPRPATPLTGTLPTTPQPTALPPSFAELEALADSVQPPVLTNTVSADSVGALIAGGDANAISGNSAGAFIGAGSGNRIGDFGYNSGIVAGFGNAIAGNNNFVGGGGYNFIGSYEGNVIAGGTNNVITGSAGNAAIPGGFGNLVSGTTSLAAGRNAKVLHDGAFAWADGSTTEPLSTTTANQFLVRAAGGVGVGTAAPDHALFVQSNDSSVWPAYHVAKFKNAGQGATDRTALVDIENGNDSPVMWRWGVGGAGNGLGFTTGQFYLEHYPGDIVMVMDATRTITFSPGAGTCTLTSGSVGWACSSDRALKENFSLADGRDVLARLARLPVSTWNARGDAAAHIGPTAQDFRAAFGLGNDDTHINSVDAQGVALAAIQGVNAKLDEQNADLRTRLEKLEQRENAPTPSVTLGLACAALGAVGMWLVTKLKKH